MKKLSSAQLFAASKNAHKRKARLNLSPNLERMRHIDELHAEIRSLTKARAAAIAIEGRMDRCGNPISWEHGVL
jgi:hypothetical protein